MKKLGFGLIVAGLLVSVANAEDKVLTTEEAEKLMSEKNYICLSCHKVDATSIGPSFQDIAVAYQGQKDIAKTLVSEIQKGVSGKWKDKGISAPMPPNNISDEDAGALVQWILSLTPAEKTDEPVKAEPSNKEIKE